MAFSSAGPVRRLLRSGITTVNSVPAPFSDSTLIVPFIISTMLFVMAMPRPVLPYLFLRVLSSWEKASKILGI